MVFFLYLGMDLISELIPVMAHWVLFRNSAKHESSNSIQPSELERNFTVLGETISVSYALEHRGGLIDLLFWFRIFLPLPC